MLLLQVMNARRREQPGGAKRGGSSGMDRPLGTRPGQRVSHNNFKHRQGETAGGKCGLSKCVGGFLPPARAGERPAESPFPPARWYPSPFAAPSSGLASPSHAARLRDAVGIQDTLHGGCWRPKWDPYRVLGTPSDHPCCLRGGCSDPSQSNPGKRNSARCRQRPGRQRDGVSCQPSTALHEALG